MNKMNENNNENDNKDNEKEESKDEVNEEEFFDANDHFVKDEDQTKHKLMAKKSNELKPRTESWFGKTLASVANVLSGQKPNENNRIKEIIISIKDETKKEIQSEEKLEEELSTASGDAHTTKFDDKTTKLQIITDKKTSEGETKKVEVIVINEDGVQIDSDNIEMSPLDSIIYIVDLIAALVLDLFIISGVSHWIYNDLDGLDWYLVDNTYFNFHIFFMTLGFCGLGFGILVHRIFRGWSSGALNFLHTTITISTLIFFMIGIYAVVVSLNQLNSIHFYSVHSWLGGFSMVCFALLWLSSIVIFVFPRFVNDIQRLLIPVHDFCGRVVFTIICGTAVVGFSDKLQITDGDIKIGPIEGRILLESDPKHSDSDYIESNPGIEEREVDDRWQMPAEALLLVVISVAIFLYTLVVNYLTTNHTFRRRILPEEQGIEITTRIKLK